jgi:AcrR family transcriptional regulator
LASESTPDRILSTALRLFNQFGVDRVPVYKIAAEIGISPGNLTYHFPRKQDILYQLIDRLECEAAQVIASKRNPGAVELAHYLVSLFRLMWRYHFFFESLTYLTATDVKIAESHQRIRELAQGGSVQRIEDAMESGDILTVEPPTTPLILAENMWAVWVNRLATTRPGTDEQTAGELVVYDCCVHHLSLIQPYASKKFIAKLHDAVKDKLQLKGEKSETVLKSSDSTAAV